MQKYLLPIWLILSVMTKITENELYKGEKWMEKQRLAPLIGLFSFKLYVLFNGIRVKATVAE